MKTSASAYVKEGKVHVLGLAQTEYGSVPFAHSFDAPEELKPGPLDLSNPIAAALVDEQLPQIQGIVKRGTWKIALESLVRRSRNGDQNAMAMLRSVGENAKRGVKRAKESFDYLKKYIERNPPGSTSGGTAIKALQEAVIGEDIDQVSSSIITTVPSIEDPYTAALVMSRGNKIDSEMIETIADRFGEDRKAFMWGYKADSESVVKESTKRPELKEPILVGFVTHMAIIIQGVCNGKLPISRLCPVAGAELGE